MKTSSIYFVLALAGALFWAACEKHATANFTVINGTVVDAKTGAPLDSTAIEFRIDKGIDNTGNHIYTTASVGTDENGRFYSDDLVNVIAPSDIFTVRRAGYISKGGGNKVVDIQLGQENNVTLPMIPKNGILHFVIKNTNNNTDTVYMVIFSPSQLQEATISYGALYDKAMYVVPPFSQVEDNFQVPTEEPLTIYWNLTAQPTRFQEFLNHWNITVSPNHTSDFIIDL